MTNDSVQEHLEILVDSLRQNRGRTPELADVAAVTEVLISTLRHHCQSLDDTIYKEFHYLAGYIAEARAEISQLKPNDIKAEKIPRAGKELEAIVQHTEEATGTIMDAAEEIMSADSTDLDGYQTVVTDACMRIFEACSFQDITGQRINKVVGTLTFIEERLNRMLAVWGPGIPDATDKPLADELARTDNDEAPLSGPALAGEGIDQSAVDHLLDGAAAPVAETAAPAGAVEAPEAAEIRTVAAAPDAPAEGNTEGGAVVGDDDLDVAAIAGSGQKSSQADIDALFD